MEINIIELEHLPVFTIKNSKALKSSKDKGFSVFIAIWDVDSCSEIGRK